MTEASAPAKEPQPYPSDALVIGTKLDGYRIKSILGRGTFGITYLAIEEHLDRLVAVKEYLPIDIAVRDNDSTVHPRTRSHGDLFQYGLESFLKEAKTLVKFKHNNIVPVLTYFEQYETAYLVMEYEVGQDLNSYFKEHPHLSENELLAIFSPVNEGLEVVHQHGFIHRDIKPDNIYIRQDQSPVLLDFGAARDVVKTKADNLTRILTEGYAPYEQDNPAWANQGPWTDIYALGATLYIAVMGRKPVNAAARAAAFMMKQEDPYISALKTTNNTYSRSFLEAIDKALEFHPKDRPQSLSAWNLQRR
jgi:serine/threonine protein kinase